MTATAIALVTLAIFFMEGPSLWKEQRMKELIGFSLLLAAGSGLSIAEAVHAPLPSLFDILSTVFRPVYRFVHSI